MYVCTYVRMYEHRQASKLLLNPDLVGTDGDSEVTDILLMKLSEILILFAATDAAKNSSGSSNRRVIGRGGGRGGGGRNAAGKNASSSSLSSNAAAAVTLSSEQAAATVLHSPRCRAVMQHFESLYFQKPALQPQKKTKTKKQKTNARQSKASKRRAFAVPGDESDEYDTDDNGYADGCGDDSSGVEGNQQSVLANTLMLLVVDRVCECVNHAFEEEEQLGTDDGAS